MTSAYLDEFSEYVLAGLLGARLHDVRALGEHAVALEELLVCPA